MAGKTKAVKTCKKCGRTMSEDDFYSHRDGTKFDLCKPCATMHIDNFDPDTYTWLLKQLDYPYSPTKWDLLRDKAFAANPKKMTGMSVLGKYISSMKLVQFKKFGWADSDTVQGMINGSGAPKKQATQEEKQAAEDFAKELDEKLERGEITQIEHDTYYPTWMRQDQMFEQSTEQEAADGQEKFYDESKYLALGGGSSSQNVAIDIPDPAAGLTSDDLTYLAMKWGKMYQVDEWLSMEKYYNEMMDSFDIQDADSKSTLILICKTNLKMNQAIDMGDFDGYTKLSRALDQMRKSAKFTAAQNKKDNGDYVDSIGALVEMVERESGFIPRWVTDIPQDKVDFTLKDMNGYLYKLVTEDLGFGTQIENYMKKIELQKMDEEAISERDDAAIANGENPISEVDFEFEEDVLTDAGVAEFYEKQADDRDADMQSMSSAGGRFDDYEKRIKQLKEKEGEKDGVS